MGIEAVNQISSHALIRIGLHSHAQLTASKTGENTKSRQYNITLKDITVQRGFRQTSAGQATRIAATLRHKHTWKPIDCTTMMVQELLE
jgi:hypothetical protein